MALPGMHRSAAEVARSEAGRSRTTPNSDRRTRLRMFVDRGASPRTLGSESWRLDAACRAHPTAWWFATGKYERALARVVCNGCVVRAECLEYALVRPKLLGLWGATTADERDTMRSRRAASHDEAHSVDAASG
jgi:WhiB family transcriptional regulator, redox-sensing transcriptional regulator